MAMAFASTRWGFYGTRFLIGAAEAGFFPGMVFYLTLWFPGRYRARMLALIAMGVPISGIVAGPLSGWIMVHMAGEGGLRGWQWLFLVEGAPAILLGIGAWLILPDRPSRARFLTSEQQRAIERDLAADTVSGSAAKDFRSVARRPRTYALALVYFAFYANAEHPASLGADPASQFRRPRSSLDRLARRAYLPGRRHRHGARRLEFGSHRRTTLGISSAAAWSLSGRS